MRQHSIVMAFGFAVLAGGCGASAQRAPQQVAGVQCGGITDAGGQATALYEPSNVERVEPIYRTEHIARAVQPRYISGARIYVPAQQGQTQAYLERVLSCHAAAKSDGHPNDPLRVANVRDIDVETRGARFVIDVQGADRTAGKEIWQRARALRDPSANVEVRQLSAADADATQL
ncbi:MAG: hypothetical protein ABW252_08310 [Polyangiales bacterium]